MAKFTKYMDFSLDSCEICRLFDSALLKNLDGYKLLSRFMKTSIDFTKSSLANGLLYIV